MTEWALPVKAQRELEDVLDRLKAAHLLDAARPFMRGGSWRNFKVKYVEAAQMYARMTEVSRLVADRQAARNYRRGAPRALSRPVQLRLLARRLRRAVHALPPLRDL